MELRRPCANPFQCLNFSGSYVANIFVTDSYLGWDIHGNAISIMPYALFDLDYMGVSGHLHAPAALHPVKEPPVPME
jgi:hypothetical protein